MVVIDECNVIDAKIDNITSMIGILSTQHEQSKLFKPRVYQGKGRSLINWGKGDKYYNNNRKRFYDKRRSPGKSRG